MMKNLAFRKFLPADLRLLELQEIQRLDLPDASLAASLIMGCNEAWTLWRDARPVACAGLIYMTSLRAKAWALIGNDITRREWAVGALRMGARLTELQDPKKSERVRRIEAEAPIGFVGGHRVLAHLGFRYETHIAGAGRDGSTLAQYARLSDVPPAAAVRLEAIRVMAYRTLVDDLMSETLVKRQEAA